MRRECAFQLMPRGSAHKFPGLFGEQLIDRLCIFALNRFTCKDDRSTIDVRSRDASLMVSSLDESAELLHIDGAVGEKRCERDRRSPEDLAAGHHKTAGKRLRLALQSYSCEQ